MLGAIAGDIIGSIYEVSNIKSTVFPLFSPGARFTDDTVLTVALADSILSRTSYGEKLREYYHLYPDAGYGGSFMRWARSKNSGPYNSWGNGSAMRVSPVGFSCGDLETVIVQAEKSAVVTHNHPEGIKGAQAVASAIFLAREKESIQEIRSFIEKRFGYDLSLSIDEIRPWYTFDVSCKGSVPQAITAFLESDGYEDAVRKAISIGGDSDTIACITGAIAEAYYGGIPGPIAEKAMEYLDDRLLTVVRRFQETFMNR